MYRVKNLQETKELARTFCSNIQGRIAESGLLIGLEGELGAGKTTFAKLLVKELGSNEEVASPSYVLERDYSGANEMQILHWDLYRLKGGQLPEDLDPDLRPNKLILVEWPSVCSALDNVINIQIKISIVDQDSREIEFVYKDT
jgi:tRNA threonylcarbamoyladenosine biosynthesis protein TsaE